MPQQASVGAVQTAPGLADNGMSWAKTALANYATVLAMAAIPVTESSTDLPASAAAAVSPEVPSGTPDPCPSALLTPTQGSSTAFNSSFTHCATLQPSPSTPPPNATSPSAPVMHEPLANTAQTVSEVALGPAGILLLINASEPPSRLPVDSPSASTSPIGFESGTAQNNAPSAAAAAPALPAATMLVPRSQIAQPWQASASALNLTSAASPLVQARISSPLPVPVIAVPLATPVLVRVPAHASGLAPAPGLASASVPAAAPGPAMLLASPAPGSIDARSTAPADPSSNRSIMILVGALLGVATAALLAGEGSLTQVHPSLCSGGR